MIFKKITIPLIGIIALSACGNPDSRKDIASSVPKIDSSSIPLEKESPSSSNIDTSTFKSIFKTSVFLGDSITDGLHDLDVLDEENIISGIGKSIGDAQENVEQVANQKPENIFILLGLCNLTETKESAVTQYSQLIQKIKEKLPNTKINILSITPVTPERIQKEERYKNINDFNEGFKMIAKKEQVNFIDLSPIFKDNPELYIKDGIHFKPEFYPIWLEYLKNQLK
ncbi:GDSL-type esterase/lipase family protein [Bacillus thuringiensis]|uniref:GDSL-type esterase/lipase family protein n=1 Tax=Bacillus thuringiensis TaxID=1428 RepID=UPI002D7EC0F2|nr:GDSL-type esterase/lipase family protein [Bacillus thuringiensis]MEB4817474.1 GDSL-type esterase/lipase family protein [Bacillus thuringiensis]